MQESATTVKKSFVHYQLPVLLWMLVIFVSSAIPSYAFPQVEFWGWAKLIHLFYYGTLCFLARRAFLHQDRFFLLRRYASLFAVLAAVLYGATDEVHQLFTPGRHGMALDVAIDSLGACLFLAGAQVLSLLSRRTSA